MAKKETYFDVLTAAVNDILEHGYDSQERIAYWTQRLEQAAETASRPSPEMEQMLRDALSATYSKLVEKGQIVDKFHFGVSRFTLERVKPQLRAELDRRILASANLIRLNRRAAVEKTLQRFAGWSTSIPKGGSDAAKRKTVKAEIKKSLGALPFEERRVLIDQGHKLTASLNDILARDGGAIALEWHSNWRQMNYNYRQDHKARDGKIYMIRPNWALGRGLVRAGKAGYYDQVTAVGEEVFCRCYARYIYTLRGLPAEMITKKGQQELDEARAQVRARMAA